MSMMLMRGYQLCEQTFKFLFSCVYGLLYISALGCICSILTVRKSVTGVLASDGCILLVL